MNKTKYYSCPKCQKTIEWKTSNTWRPFCSERCQLVDLNKWDTEEYVVSSKNEEKGTDDYSEID